MRVVAEPREDDAGTIHFLKNTIDNREMDPNSSL